MKIAYVGPFSFPSSSANSLRVKGLSEVFLRGGHEVTVCAGLPFRSDLKDEKGTDRISVCAVNEYARFRLLRRVPAAAGLFLGAETVSWLKTGTVKPDVVVLYGTHMGYLTRLRRYCNSVGIPLILDVVEWYDPRHLPGGPLGPYAFLHEFSMRSYARHADGIMAISSFLSSHFRRMGVRTIQVPPLFDFGAKATPSFDVKSLESGLALCYVGSPGRKDHLQTMLCGLQMARDLGADFVLHVVGVSSDELLQWKGVARSCKKLIETSVRFHGKLENSAALQIIADCDFSMLLRSNRRYANAGFPSKIPESLGLGTPVISNITSDLGKYLVDGVNSVLVSDATAESLSSAVLRACALSKDDRQKMRRAAWECAERYFRPVCYWQEVDRFLNSCRR